MVRSTGASITIKAMDDRPSSSHKTNARKWTREQWAALRCCYLAYFSLIFSRTAVAVALPAMQADPAMALSHATLSRVLSSSSLVYFAGKMLSGTVVDACGGRATLVMALASCAGAYAVFAAAGGGLSAVYAGELNTLSRRVCSNGASGY